MTKEDLRRCILELDSEIDQETDDLILEELKSRQDDLVAELENTLYDELANISIKEVNTRIIDRNDIDTDTLVFEYMDSGDLKKSFEIAADDCIFCANETTTKELIENE